MIELNSSLGASQGFNQSLIQHLKTKETFQPKELESLTKAAPSESFGNMIGDLVKDVDNKGKVAMEETNKMLLGETDNIHQSMIAMQESGLAFTMLVEVRNKLVQSYQELMRMPV